MAASLSGEAGGFESYFGVLNASPQTEWRAPVGGRLVKEARANAGKLID